MDSLKEFLIVMLVSIFSGVLLIVVLQFLTGCAVERPELDTPGPLPYYEKSYSDFDPNLDLPKDNKNKKSLKSKKR